MTTEGDRWETERGGEKNRKGDGKWKRRWQVEKEMASGLGFRV
jgi:hypothetical protein